MPQYALKGPDGTLYEDTLSTCRSEVFYLGFVQDIGVPTRKINGDYMRESSYRSKAKRAGFEAVKVEVVLREVK